MDVAAIDAALDDAVVAAVATTPQGLTAASQVYVAGKQRDMGSNTVEGWLRRVDGTPRVIDQKASHNLVAYEVDLTLIDHEGSADGPTWGDQILAAFHGVALEGIGNMATCSVSDLTYEGHPGEGAATSMKARLTFVGWRDR